MLPNQLRKTTRPLHKKASGPGNRHTPIIGYCNPLVRFAANAGTFILTFN